MVGAFDVHFEVVRNPVLTQQISKADGGHRHLPMPMAAASRAGHVECAPFRMIFVDPELHFARFSRHGHVLNHQPAIANGFWKTGRYLTTESLVGLHGNDSETAFEIESRVVTIVHPHIKDEVRSG